MYDSDRKAKRLQETRAQPLLDSLKPLCQLEKTTAKMELLVGLQAARSYYQKNL